MVRVHWWEASVRSQSRHKNAGITETGGEPLGAGFPSGSTGKGSQSLAEGGSDGSEAHQGWKRKKYDLDRVVNSESETTKQGRGGWRRSGCFGRFGTQCFTHLKSRWRFLERGWWGKLPLYLPLCYTKRGGLWSREIKNI